MNACFQRGGKWDLAFFLFRIIILLQVIMAMEDEFGFEIPDDHGERLLTPKQIVRKGNPAHFFAKKKEGFPNFCRKMFSI